MNHKFDEELMQTRGLGFCKQCYGAEATLPTHCPGFHMPVALRTNIQAGLVDYKDDSWRVRRGVEQKWKNVKSWTLII